jgi:hypothetical protein
MLEVEEYKVNEKGGSVGYGIPITKDTIFYKKDPKLSLS